MGVLWIPACPDQEITVVKFIFTVSSLKDIEYLWTLKGNVVEYFYFELVMQTEWFGG